MNEATLHDLDPPKIKSKAAESGFRETGGDSGGRPLDGRGREESPRPRPRPYQRDSEGVRERRKRRSRKRWRSKPDGQPARRHKNNNSSQRDKQANAWTDRKRNNYFTAHCHSKPWPAVVLSIPAQVSSGAVYSTNFRGGAMARRLLLSARYPPLPLRASFVPLSRSCDCVWDRHHWNFRTEVVNAGRKEHQTRQEHRQRTRESKLSATYFPHLHS